MSRLGTPGLALGNGTVPAVPLPNGPVHKLDTSAGAATTAELGPRCKAIGMTLTDPHWITVNGTPATAGDNGEFKVPGGFSFWPVRGAVAVSLFPEDGAAANGDSIQVVAEYS
jgi:hypothetical protein